MKLMIKITEQSANAFLRELLIFSFNKVTKCKESIVPNAAYHRNISEHVLADASLPPKSPRDNTIHTHLKSGTLIVIYVEGEEIMSKTTNNWKSSFAAMRERFGNTNDNESDEFYPFTNVYSVSATSLSNTLACSKSHDNYSAQTFDPLNSAINKSVQKQERKTDLGSFWMKKVNSREKLPNSHRSIVGLTAAEHLEQLHELVEDDINPPNDGSLNLQQYKQSQLNSVAARRNTYLRETTRFHNPNTPFLDTERGINVNKDLCNYSTSITPGNATNNDSLSSFDHITTNFNKTTENSIRNGCGRFPTSESIEAINQPREKKYDIHVNDQFLQFDNKHSPSPDTLSDISQNSLCFLPHPRPKHNIHEQLLNAGVTTANMPTTMKSVYRSSSPNFPSPNYNSVAMRISALEKQPGIPTILNLAGTNHTAPPTTSTMSPKSTVFRTKPVIHADKEQIQRSDNKNRKTETMTETVAKMSMLVNDRRSTNGQNNLQSFFTPPSLTFSESLSKMSSELYSEAPLAEKQNQPSQKIDYESLINKNKQNNEISKRRPSKMNTFYVDTPTTIENGHIKKAENVTCWENQLPLSSHSIVFAGQNLNSSYVKHAIKNVHSNAPAPTTSTCITTNKKSIKTSMAGKLADIKQFHYPFGIPVKADINEAMYIKIRDYFKKQTLYSDGKLDFTHFDKICELINFPIYAKRAVYEACCRLNNIKFIENTVNNNKSNENYDANKLYDANSSPPINLKQFTFYWNRMTTAAHDEASRFIFTLACARSSSTYELKNANKDRKNSNSYLIPSDFTPMLMDLIDSHPGLYFLKTSPQFHGRYCEVVTVRIFWDVNRSWTGRITPSELRRSKFLKTLRMLEEVTDVNKVTDFFSYEHFYVTYCKFWELDSDHDMIISRNDMREHGGGALTDRIIDRIFSAAVLRLPSTEHVRCGNGPVVQQPIETIGFEDFVAFLLAEEDKRHPMSIEYWFRCIDLDGDGVISLYEMEYFYSEIEKKLLSKNMETLSLTDVICNLLDSISPSRPNCVTRSDLKRSGLAHRFFNTFVNYVKYLDQESSEGERASVKIFGDREMSDWETFCAIEYELLMIDTDVSDGAIDVVLNADEC